MAVTRQAWKWRNHKSDNSQVISFTRWAASPSPPFFLPFFLLPESGRSDSIESIANSDGRWVGTPGEAERRLEIGWVWTTWREKHFFSAVFEHFRLFSCSATSWNYCDFWRSLWILSSTPFPSCGLIYVIGSSFHSVTKTQCCHTVFFTLLWKIVVQA